MNSFSDVLQAAFLPVLSAAPSPFNRLVTTFVAGYRQFEQSGETPPPSYLAMRQLFCATNGEFNDVVHRLLSNHRGAAPAARGSNGVLGAMEGDALAQVIAALDRDGFHVFEHKLPSAICDSLRRLALATPCRIGSAATATAPATMALYDRDHLRANRYDVPEVVVAQNSDVQSLLMDDSVRAVATAYLGCEPILDFVSMWWLAPFSTSAEALSKAAQLYHFDMDRLKFLKFFVYLTDVTSQNSPHCYVRGSCRRKPPALLRDGRIPDAEIARHFPAEDLVELTAPSGTIFAVDTRGFHKGKSVEAGERLVLQLELTNSLFGQNYGQMAIPAAACTPRFAEYLAAHPEAAGRFRLAAG